MLVEKKVYDACKKKDVNAGNKKVYECWPEKSWLGMTRMSAFYWQEKSVIIEENFETDALARRVRFAMAGWRETQAWAGKPGNDMTCKPWQVQ